MRRLGKAVAAVLLVGLAAGPAAANRAGAVSNRPDMSGTSTFSNTAVLSVRRIPLWVESTLAAQHLYATLSSIAGSAVLDPTQASDCIMVSQGSQVLYSISAHSLLIPASNMKLLTATAVLDRLGPADHLVTSVSGDRAPENGVEYGNLYLVGGGDPLLRTGSYAASLFPPQPLYTSLDQLASQVRRAGITEVTGLIVGDDSRYDRQRTVATWKPVYSTEGDVGPLSALDVNDGFVPKPPPPPTTTPPTTAPPSASQGQKGPGPTTTTTVAHTAPQGATSTAAAFAYAAAANPPQTAAEEFATLLRREGVIVRGGAVSGYQPSNAVPITSIQSATLGAEVDAMLNVSDDTAAELFTKELGYQISKSGTTAAGVAAIRADLAADGLPISEMVNVDGSGLDRGDRASCNLLVDALRRAGPGGVIAKGLPVAGQTGTLSRRFIGTDAAGRLRAKTGTLDEVVSLSGFVTPLPRAPTGTAPLVFSIIFNGLPGVQAQYLADQIGVALAGYPQVPALAEVQPRG